MAQQILKIQNKAELGDKLSKIKSWPALPWDLLAIENSLSTRGTALFILTEDGDTRGFILGRFISEFAEIFYIYVPPTYRRRSYAKQLMLYFENEAFTIGLERILLEVNTSNFPALELYEGLGFNKLHLKKSYYQDGGDAWLMVRQLPVPT